MSPFGVSFFDREKSRISLNETGKDQIAVILRKMSAHQIFRQPRAALHRQANRTVLIQHDKIRNICKSVILRHLIMHGRADALTAVCGVILHNCPVYLDAFSLDSRLRAAGTVDGMPGRTKGKATTFPVMALSVFRSVLRSEIS